jgi:hypothetical protein
MTKALRMFGSELTGAEIIASGAKVATGNSGDLNLSDVIEADAICLGFGVVLDITVQGGTQASIDFDLEGKYAGKYVRLCRYNSVPADGVVAQMLVPNVGTKPLPIGGSALSIPIPDVFRLAWTFNTPGATPTITLSAHAVAWGFRNSANLWPPSRL